MPCIWIFVSHSSNMREFTVASVDRWDFDEVARPHPEPKHSQLVSAAPVLKLPASLTPMLNPQLVLGKDVRDYNLHHKVSTTPGTVTVLTDRSNSKR